MQCTLHTSTHAATSDSIMISSGFTKFPTPSTTPVTSSSLCIHPSPDPLSDDSKNTSDQDTHLSNSYLNTDHKADIGLDTSTLHILKPPILSPTVCQVPISSSDPSLRLPVDCSLPPHEDSDADTDADALEEIASEFLLTDEKLDDLLCAELHDGPTPSSSTPYRTRQSSISERITTPAIDPAFSCRSVSTSLSPAAHSDIFRLQSRSYACSPLRSCLTVVPGYAAASHATTPSDHFVHSRELTLTNDFSYVGEEESAEPSTLTNITTIAVLKPVSSEPDAASVGLPSDDSTPLSQDYLDRLYTSTFDNVDLDKLEDLADTISDSYLRVDMFTVIDQWENELWDEARICSKIRNLDAISQHSQLTTDMRWLVTDWIREVAAQHKLSRKTFHMAVNFLDGFIALHKNMPDDDFQVLGATCLFIATKLEDCWPPTFRQLAAFTVSGITDPCEVNRVLDEALILAEDIEASLLHNMKWDALIPTTIDFLARYFQLAYFFWPQPVMTELPPFLQFALPKDDLSCISTRRFDAMIYAHAASIMDQAVCIQESLSFSNSIISAAAFWQTWPDKDTRLVVFETVTGYKKYHIDPCLDFLGRHDIQPENIVGIMRDLMWDVVVSANEICEPFDLVDNQVMGRPISDE
ncbi:hypothetical protein BASA50_003243 [Batrachochytrium salamandrivorans]|uniref:Cyclin-like domain-containing protein n=1 Tax=Batrachochytrium salamandrivorans TaxID=1357716 RepID=A0ABQ8FJ93_9FUNG|nr:hypothetical protein BASA50_003243 [Batrachochytrium salamandrivorans]KAH9269489.1 hypothetical protein BASA83_008439 [Batrachochytrium salamandrivorans]